MDLLFFSFLLTIINSFQFNYYVSSAGNDIIGDGKIQNPFKTITKAQNHIRSILDKNIHYNHNITVYIENGEYYESLTLSSKDSLPNNYITYKGINSFTNNNSIKSVSNNTIIRSGGIINGTWTLIHKYSNNLSLYKTNFETNNQLSLLNNNSINELFCDNIRLSMSKTEILKYDDIYVNQTKIKNNINLDISSKDPRLYEIKEQVNGYIVVNNREIPYIEDIISKNYKNRLMIVIYETWTSSIHLVNNIEINNITNRINIYFTNSPQNWLAYSVTGKRFFLLNTGI